MKIGVISFAHMHAYSYASVLKKLPGVQLAAVYDDDEERGKKASEMFGASYDNDLEQFLNRDLQAVIVCSENSRHRYFVEKAAKAKKHILCEKPIATNLEDARAIIEVCKKNGVILQIAFPVRFLKPIAELKRMINEHQFGEIIAIRTTNRGQNPGGWFVDKRYSGGGAVIDHTVHMVDIMRWYLGKEVKEVYAQAGSLFSNSGIDDAGLLTLTFENGVIASHDASWSRNKNFPTWGDVTIEVLGTEGRAVVDAYREHVEVYSDRGKAFIRDFYGFDMDYGLIWDFIQCVSEGRKPSITGFDGLKAVEVALAAYESAKKKAPVLL
jgi:predicted dehydrogenase